MRKRTLLEDLQEHRSSFAIAFLGFFTLFFMFLMAVDATPDPIAEVEREMAPEAQALEEETVPLTELPVRVEARAVKLDVRVNNPLSTDVYDLDESLLSGAVRYPTSAHLGQEGTVLLFGHSSYLPVVRNQAYKAFNEIQKLKSGDIVSLYSETLEYRYAVTGVVLADATQDNVELPTSGKHLKLITCDSFTKKTDRFIVSADFVGAYPLES